MNKKIHISLLLVTMPALNFCMETSPIIAILKENLANAHAIDAFVKSEIIAYKKAHPQDQQLSKVTGQALWNQRLISLKNLGEAKIALDAAQAQHA